MPLMLGNGWSMFRRPPFLHSTEYRFPFKAVRLKNKSKRGRSVSQVTPQGRPVNREAASRGSSSRDESPLGLTLGWVLKLVGIIRGFSGKCDNSNLEGIIVEINAPFGRRMSREVLGEPIQVERWYFSILLMYASQTEDNGWKRGWQYDQVYFVHQVYILAAA